MRLIYHIIMKCIGIFLSRLSFQPKVEKIPGGLEIRSGWFLRLLHSFRYPKEVEINVARKYVMIDDQTIPFNKIESLQFGYEGSEFAEEDIDNYTLKVVTHNRDFHPICAFRGEDADTEWVEDFAPALDSEAYDAKTFARGLATVLGVSISR